MLQGLKSFLLRRFPAAVVATALLIGLFAAAALIPISLADAENLVNQFEQILPNVVENPAFIFLNNFAASLLMMIPVLGLALAGLIVYNTGAVIGAFSAVSNIPVPLLLLIPFITVYGFIEMLAYGFAVSESFFLTTSAIRKQLRKEIRSLPYTVAVVVLLLLAGAVIEWILIRLSAALTP
ncbi:MAG: stage II sporulation protein M [Candidatus Caldarchaeum sp.]